MIGNAFFNDVNVATIVTTDPVVGVEILAVDDFAMDDKS